MKEGAPSGSSLTPNKIALAALILIVLSLVFGENPGGENPSVTARGELFAAHNHGRRSTRAGKAAAVASAPAPVEEEPKETKAKKQSEKHQEKPKKAAAKAREAEKVNGEAKEKVKEEEAAPVKLKAEAKEASKPAKAKSGSAAAPNYSKSYKAYLATGWFGPNGHPWAEAKDLTCPSGCKINFANRANAGSMRPEDADIVLFHGKDLDWDYGESLLQQPRKEGQLRAIMAAENTAAFTRILFDKEKLSKLDVDVSYRPQSFFRDFQYPLEAIRRWSNGATTATMESTWDEVTSDSPDLALVDPRKRRKLDEKTITFATGHCASASGREDYTLELLNHVPVEVYGAPCMKHAHASAEMMALDRDQQWAKWRSYKFYLAFENYRAPGYHTEKLFLTFIRGQIPIVLGGSDVEEHVPSKDSYLDVRDFASPAALAARLKEIDEDDDEFMKFFEWRKRPFSSYGRFFREAIEISLPTAKAKGDWSASASYFTCGLCNALAQWDADGRPMPKEPVQPYENEGKMEVVVVANKDNKENDKEKETEKDKGAAKKNKEETKSRK